MRIGALACLLVLCAGAHAQEVGKLIAGHVTRVVDGDTFDIGRTRARLVREGWRWRLQRTWRRRIRIWGTDAAERRERCSVEGRVLKLAKPSKQALEDCLRGTTITCRAQKVERRQGKLRYVSECWRDDTKEDVAACMVSSGWATDWPGYSGAYYAPLEAEPKAARRGLWQCEGGPPTRRWCKGGEGRARRAADLQAARGCLSQDAALLTEPAMKVAGPPTQ